MGIHLTFGIPFLGFVPGMIGLILVMIHGAPGFHLATALGLRAPNVVVHGIQHLYVDALSGVVWGFFYGAIGAGVDRWRAELSNRALQPPGFAGG